MPGKMCGVQAMVLMPSADAMRAMANDMARSFEPSSIPGSRWQCRSIKFVARFSSTVTEMTARPYPPVNPVARPFYKNRQSPLRIRANDAFPQQSLASRQPLKKPRNCHFNEWSQLFGLC